MKKMKTPIQLWVLSATLLGLGTQTLMANECCSSPFSGFYLGGAIGGSFSSAREGSATNLSSGFTRTTVISEEVPFRIQNTLEGSAQHRLQGTQRKNNFAVSLYAGFGCAWEDVYLGLEAFLRRTDYRKTHRAIFNATESTDVPNIFRLDARASNAIALTTRLSPTEPGIDFRPGFFLTPCTMLYGRVGVAYNRLTLHTRTISSALITPPLTVGASPLIGTDAASKHKKVGALRLGVGLEQHLGECMSIRVDYINTHYRGIKIRTRGVSDTNTTTTTVLPATTITTETRFNANTTAEVRSFYNNAITLGISYYW
jgi:opacity protein-like surface antigen